MYSVAFILHESSACAKVCSSNIWVTEKAEGQKSRVGTTSHGSFAVTQRSCWTSGKCVLCQKLQSNLKSYDWYKAQGSASTLFEFKRDRTAPIPHSYEDNSEKLGRAGVPREAGRQQKQHQKKFILSVWLAWGWILGQSGLNVRATWRRRGERQLRKRREEDRHEGQCKDAAEICLVQPWTTLVETGVVPTAQAGFGSVFHWQAPARDLIRQKRGHEVSLGLLQSLNHLWPCTMMLLPEIFTSIYSVFPNTLSQQAPH